MAKMQVQAADGQLPECHGAARQEGNAGERLHAIAG